MYLLLNDKYKSNVHIETSVLKKTIKKTIFIYFVCCSALSKIFPDVSWKVSVKLAATEKCFPANSCMSLLFFPSCFCSSF